MTDPRADVRIDNLRFNATQCVKMAKAFLEKYGGGTPLHPNNLDELAMQCAATSEAFSMLGERAQRISEQVMEDVA